MYQFAFPNYYELVEDWAVEENTNINLGEEIEENYLQSFEYCRNPSLGLVTKARACKSVGQEGSLGVKFHALESVGKCEGMNRQTPK